MRATHLELLVEDRSTEAFLSSLLPRILPEGCTFKIIAFQGKPDLLRKLEGRLRGYRHTLLDNQRLIVLVDRDNEDCRKLKRSLEEMAKESGLMSKSRANTEPWQLVNRIAIEELEAWYFGDWEAVCAAFPRLSTRLVSTRGYRDPDSILGGTWEAFERILKKSGYFTTGLRKIEAARTIAPHIDPERSRSHSFRVFHQTIIEATR